MLKVDQLPPSNFELYEDKLLNLIQDKIKFPKGMQNPLFQESQKLLIKHLFNVEIIARTNNDMLFLKYGGQHLSSDIKKIYLHSLQQKIFKALSEDSDDESRFKAIYNKMLEISKK